MDSTRQNKISRLIQKETAQYFITNAGEFPGAMVSVSEVRITPDLDEARIFVSIFPTDKRDAVLGLIENDNKKIRYALGQKLRYQLRRIPNLVFFLDQSLDYAERIDQLLKNN